MRRKRTHRILIVAALVAASLGVHRDSRGDEAETTIVVVVQKSSPLHDVSTTELRNLYRQSSGFIDGHKTIPVNLTDGSSARVVFDRVIHGWSASESARYWTDRKIRGGAAGPKEMTTPKSVQMTVYKYPKLVGYVPLSAFRSDKLRALKVNGYAYDSPDYPLRSK